MAHHYIKVTNYKGKADINEMMQQTTLQSCRSKNHSLQQEVVVFRCK